MERQKQYKVTGELAQVQAILSNLELYAKVHPLIKEARKIPNENGLSLLYEITERPYKRIPIDIKYLAEVTTTANEVEYHITEIPFTKADIKYKLKQIDHNSTEINFNLRISSKMLGKRILMNKMMKAQDELMNSMEEEMKN